MVNIIFKSKKNNVIFDKKLKKIIIKGTWGNVSKTFSGTDIDYFDKNKIFIRSKKSFQFLKNYLINTSYTTENGYFIALNLVGLGFRFLKIENYLLIKVGHSHYIKIFVPKGLQVVGFKRRFLIFGVDKNQVHTFANLIRLQRKPDSYKGKGILYDGEKVNLKVGKQK